MPLTKQKSFPKLTDFNSYKALQKHYESIKDLHMRRLFSVDNFRFQKFHVSHHGLLLDYSKNRITTETINLLCNLVREAGVESWRDKMFSGEKINHTEKRAVLHTALRNINKTPVYVDGEDVMPGINRVLEKIHIFSEKVRQGHWRGYSGKRITDVVNIGIGGSDLGPRMVYQALSAYRHEKIKVHFVANVDGAHIEEILNNLNPQTTLFIISSKTFTTQETLSNALVAREWFVKGAKDRQHVHKHFVAVSTNQDAVEEFGISPELMFEFWDWVGGRYSLWSAIGLSIVIAVGMGNFVGLLTGAHSMDEHFRKAPLDQNMPVILALLGIWYNNFFGAESYGIFPYDHCLRSLPAYLEQADMESNGKSVDRHGNNVNYATAPIIWGCTGINGQHAFYQAIHQGTRLIPADFVVSMQTHCQNKHLHNIMVANALAQTEALMRGRNMDETLTSVSASGRHKNDLSDSIKHMCFEGNSPSNTLMIDKITPKTLGMLLAMYEHKVFVQGIIWNLNSFDQWGVELGKELAGSILKEIHMPYPANNHDASTNALVNIYRDKVRGEKIFM